MKETLTQGSIQLDDEYYLRSDTDNWVLIWVKETPGEDKKVITSRNVWYFNNIEQATRKYLSEAAKPATTVIELEALIRKAYKNILNLISQLKSQ